MGALVSTAEQIKLNSVQSRLECLRQARHPAIESDCRSGQSAIANLLAEALTVAFGFHPFSLARRDQGRKPTRLIQDREAVCNRSLIRYLCGSAQFSVMSVTGSSTPFHEATLQ